MWEQVIRQVYLPDVEHMEWDVVAARGVEGVEMESPDSFFNHRWLCRKLARDKKGR